MLLTPPDADRRLGFDTVRDRLVGLARTPYGRERLTTLAASSDPEIVRGRLGRAEGLQHAGGGKFTSFRGLQEVKTKAAGDVRVAVLGENAAKARRGQRRVLGRSSATPKAAPKKKNAASPFMASGRKVTQDDSDSDEEWDPDA